MNLVEAIKEMRGGKVVRRRQYKEDRWRIIDIPGKGDTLYHWYSDDNFSDAFDGYAPAFSLEHFDSVWEVVPDEEVNDK